MSVHAGEASKELEGRTVPCRKLGQDVEALQMGHCWMDARQACMAQALGGGTLRQGSSPQLLYPCRPAEKSHKTCRDLPSFAKPMQNKITQAGFASDWHAEDRQT